MAQLCLQNGAEIERANGQHRRTAHFVACWKGHTNLVRLCLDHGADVDRTNKYGVTPLWVASRNAHIEATRLRLSHGANIDSDFSGLRSIGHATMAAWLMRVRHGWTRYLSEPRYKFVVLQALVTRGRARRERAFHGEERVLDFLFPAPTPPQASKHAKRLPHLPDDLLPFVTCYYWGGGMWAEEEAAAVAEAAEASDSDEDADDADDEADPD